MIARTTFERQVRRGSLHDLMPGGPLAAAARIRVMFDILERRPA